MLESYTLVIAAIGLVLFFLGQEAILTGLIVSSVLQAMAFINIGGSPIIVYYFFGGLFIFRSLCDLLMEQKGGWQISGQSAPLICLFGFTALAVLGSLFLPQAFYGLLVYSPKLSIDEQFSGMTRLALGSSHFNQAAQLLVNTLICFVIWFGRISPAVLIRAIFLGFYVCILFAVWQFISNATGIYFPEEWLYTVEGWSLGNQQWIGSFSRVNGSFVEPSLLSTYLTGFFSFSLIWWVRRPSWSLLLGIFLTIFVMLITASSTAYLGLLFVLTAVLLGLGLTQILNGGWIDKTLLYIFMALVTVIWLGAIIVIGSGEVRELLNLVLLQKSEGDSFRVRLDADIQSLQILWQTYGLGAGLGSNRPSSFFMSLLSNVGILGFVLFTVFNLSLSRLALQDAKKSGEERLINWSIAAVWGLWTTIFAKAISQPDVSYSPMWVWIFLLVSFAPAIEVKKSRATGFSGL